MKFNYKLFKTIKIISIFFLNLIILLIPAGMILNYLKTGKVFNYQERFTDNNCSFMPVDPIFGYIKNINCQEKSYSEIKNNIGFTKEFDINKSSDDTLDVLIIGGSVASALTEKSNFENNLKFLLKDDVQLNKKFKDVNVFNASLGGMKQPQGLFTYIALTSLGYEFDIVIELSGYNETTIPIVENFHTGINPIYPRLSHYQYLKSSKTLNNNIIGNLSQKLLALHPFYQYISQNTFLFEILESNVMQKNERKMSSKRLGFNFLMPHNDEQAFKQGYNIWKRSVENIYGLTKEDNVSYLLVIQPNQYQNKSKLLSLEEKALIVTDENQHVLYKIFKKSSFVLRASNIIRQFYSEINPEEFKIPRDNILDLRMIFKDNNETLYMDVCCHLNKKGMNYLSASILDNLKKRKIF